MVAACFLAVAASAAGQAVIIDQALLEEVYGPDGGQLPDGGEAPDAGEPPQEGEDAGVPQEFPSLACYQQAIRHVDVDSQRAIELCRGADSAGPAQCFIQARAQTFLSIEKAMELCTCATSTTPVACFNQARAGTFLEDHELVRLCSPVYSGQLPLGCVLPYGYRLGY
ncbi:MAG: hypothetical protein ACYC8T_19810 [Myxococcaceae bacterium]